MAWWKGAQNDKIRVLVGPDEGSTENSKGHFLSLCHPKSGIKTTYLLISGSLQELHWFKQSYGSWFLGDYVCEDGRLYSSTPVDPVFIALPIFEKARMKKGDDPGKFRQIDEMIFVDGYPGYQHLLPVLEKSMSVVCEVKEIGSSKFFRLDDRKVLCWMCIKVELLRQTLLSLDKNYGAQDEKQTLADALSILGEYIKEDPWLKLLCSHFRLSPEELNKNAAEVDVVTTDNSFGSSSLQEESRVEKKGAGNGKQTKKAKVETNSRNIKDMFSRATRRSSNAN